MYDAESGLLDLSSWLIEYIRFFVLYAILIAAWKGSGINKSNTMNNLLV